MKTIVSVGYVLAGGGGGDLAYQTALASYERGNLVKVICPRCDGNGIGRERVRRVLPYYKIMPLLLRTPLRKRLDYALLLQHSIFDLLARKELDPCDIFHGWPMQCRLSLRRAKAMGAKVILEGSSSHILNQVEQVGEEHRRFGVPITPWNRWVIRRILREYEEADLLTASSSFALQSFQARGIPAERLALVPYGVDPERFQPAQKPDDVFRVCHVGQADLRKGVQYLLRAFEELNLPRAELVLHGWVNPNATRIVDEYRRRMPNLVLTNGDPRPVYARASVFVLASMEEGSALATYEAMACGLPSVVTPNAGAVVRDGIDGFVVPARDVEALKDRLEYLFRHPAAGRAMGVEARSHVTAQYTWAHYRKRVADLYKNILGLKEGNETCPRPDISYR